MTESRNGTSNTIDMRDVLHLLEEAVALCTQLDDQPLNVERPNNKDLQARNAQRSRDLQYAAHLVDSARVAVDRQYHRFKGDTS